MTSILLLAFALAQEPEHENAEHLAHVEQRVKAVEAALDERDRELDEVYKMTQELLLAHGYTEAEVQLVMKKPALTEDEEKDHEDTGEDQEEEQGPFLDATLPTPLLPDEPGAPLPVPFFPPPEV